MGITSAQTFKVPIDSGMTESQLAKLVAVYEQKQKQNQLPAGHLAEYLNPLIRENSPYLLRHATNPINWQAWSPQVFEQAKKHNKLVFFLDCSQA